MHLRRLQSLLRPLFLALLFVAIGASNPSDPSPRLPPHMRTLQLPHTFTAYEMEAIRMRLRSFLLELQTFAAAAPMMSQDQLQMNYAQSVWPMMRCLVANQDSRCAAGQTQ